MDDTLEFILYVVGLAAILILRAIGQQKKKGKPSSPAPGQEPLSALEALFGIEEEKPQVKEEEPVSRPVYEPTASTEEERNLDWDEGERWEEDIPEEPVPIEVKTPVMKSEDAFLDVEMSELQEEGESITAAFEDPDAITDAISGSEIGSATEQGVQQAESGIRSEIRKAIIYSEILNPKYIKDKR